MNVVCLANMAHAGHSYPTRPRLNSATQPNSIQQTKPLNQAASFDVDLVARIVATVALETRASNVGSLNRTQGQALNGVNCDGGPLANSAHDPRWGRCDPSHPTPRLSPHLLSHPCLDQRLT